MGLRKYRTMVGDFETTVYDGQKTTEVWASAIVELYTEEVKIFNSIDETFEYLASAKGNIILYYHNLKFDGAFWLSYLLVDRNFQQAVEKTGERINDVQWLNDKQMKNKTFKYSISDKGQFYSITIKINGKYIQIRDSLKLLPFSVKKIGKSFETKHKKLEMEYTGFRYSGCKITDEEKEYIKNDVLIVAKALNILFSENLTKMTSASNALNDYKEIIGKNKFSHWFTNLDYNVDKDIRQSYKGGFTYLNPIYKEKIVENINVLDVNSLYPSVMQFCKMPIR